VRASLEEIKLAAGDRPYEVACINGPKETVLGGLSEHLDSLNEPLESAGYKCYSLNVPFAFHSSQTNPILDEFEELAILPLSSTHPSSL